MSEKLKFDDPVVLVGGGELDLTFLQGMSHLPIVAADGGANQLRKHEIVPEAIVGDLDSVEDLNYWRQVSSVVKVAEQDSTDFEKCLYSIMAPCFIAIGFTGGRLDHTLAAIHILQKIHQTKQVLLVSSDDVVYVTGKSVELKLPVGTRVSLYPLNRTTFKSSSGLLYPLDNLTLQSGEMIGTSNASTEPVVTIVPQSTGGCYALLLPLTEFNVMREFIETQVSAI